MNIEESIEYLRNYKYDNEVRQAIETLLTAYEQKCNYIKENEIYKKNLFDNYEEKCKELEKEKETSHYNQSQLDIANAKLVEEKEKNKKIEIIANKFMSLAECLYWNYENHTCTHTCRDCVDLNDINKRTSTGIIIDKDRYCRLYEDGYAEEDTKFVNVEDLINRHLKEE